MTAPRDVAEAIANALVDRAGRVTVTEAEHRGIVRITVSTPPGELGKLIGRHGRTASAIRVMAEIAAERVGRQVRVDFEDEPDQDGSDQDGSDDEPDDDGARD